MELHSLLGVGSKPCQQNNETLQAIESVIQKSTETGTIWENDRSFDSKELEEAVQWDTYLLEERLREVEVVRVEVWRRRGRPRK